MRHFSLHALPREGSSGQRLAPYLTKCQLQLSLAKTETLTGQPWVQLGPSPVPSEGVREQAAVCRRGAVCFRVSRRKQLNARPCVQYSRQSVLNGQGGPLPALGPVLLLTQPWGKCDFYQTSLQPVQRPTSRSPWLDHSGNQGHVWTELIKRCHSKTKQCQGLRSDALRCSR